MAVSVSERGHIIWGTCKGRPGEPGKQGTVGVSYGEGSPRGTIVWSLHINDTSKNPSKQSLVRESDQQKMLK